MLEKYTLIEKIKQKLNKLKIISEIELYQRINKIAETAIRGLDEFKFYTKDEALSALAAYKKIHPRKCKRAKVKILNWKKKLKIKMFK